MDAMSPSAAGSPDFVASVQERIAALRAEIAQLEQLIRPSASPQRPPARPTPRGAVRPLPPDFAAADRAITETKVRTNQPTGSPSDIQALRELMRKGPGVASQAG
jgi:hypothetical protein